MRLTLTHLTCTALLLTALPCFGLSHARRVTSSPIRHVSLRTHGMPHASLSRASMSRASLSHSGRSHAAASRSAVPRHQPVPAMDAERATAIQSALIKSGYMEGEPTGTWDAGSMAAMQKLQLDNGWQTKIVPDSRALIKLGLGPQTPQTQP